MNMNLTTAVFLTHAKEVRAVKVSYEKDTEAKTAPRYLYKTFDKEMKAGDYVVVPTSTRHGMTVCKVTDVDVQVDLESDAQVKWIIGRFSKEDYDAVLAWEDKIVGKIRFAQANKKREDLRKALEDSVNGAIDDIKALPLYKTGG